MAALVGGDRDRVRVFLDRGLDDLVDRAVVAEVDHLGALRLEQPPHDVDGGVVAVEEAGGRHDPESLAGALGGPQLGRGGGAHDAPRPARRRGAPASIRLRTWSRYFPISSRSAISSSIRASSSPRWLPSSSSSLSSIASVEPPIA